MACVALGKQSVDGFVGQRLLSQQLRCNVGDAAFLLSPLDGATRRLGIAVFDDSKHSIEGCQHRCNCIAIGLVKLALIHGGIRETHQFEDRRTRLGGIQVIGKSGDVVHMSFLAADWTSGFSPAGNAPFTSRS